MNRSFPAACVLAVLLTQLAACQPEPEPGNTPAFETSPFSLASSPRDADSSMDEPGTSGFRGVLTTRSTPGELDFRYDAFIVTARESARVVIKSSVLEVNPEGYRYGYGYPLSMTTIADGVSLTAYGGSYLQNALETGTAIIDYPVLAGHQYILVYKTFGKFTPLTYRLSLPSMLTIEGRIDTLPEPVPVPQGSTGSITLENPRPDALKRFVPWLSEKVRGN